MKRPLTLGYVPAFLPSYEAAEHHVIERSLSWLEAYGADAGAKVRAWPDAVVDRDSATVAARAFHDEGVDLVILQSSTFAMGDLVLPFHEHGLRICLWAPAEPRREGPIPLNSLVSMHLHAGVLRRHAGVPAGRLWWLYGDGNHPWCGPRLDAYLRATAALAGTDGARIGWVGGTAPTFLSVAIDRGALRRSWGTDVVPLELGAMIDAAERADPAEIERVERDLREAVGGRVGASEEDMAKGASVIVALRQLVEEHDLDALAVSDWPLFQERMRTHPGMAFSWLDEADGIPVASEGDVAGALSMLVGRRVSGSGAMLLDVNDVDLERDALLMWHCGGSPLSFADEAGARWTPHTTLGRKSAEPPMGTVADLRFRPGPVTAFRIGCSGGCVFALDAEVIESPHPGFDGSRGWVSSFRGAEGTASVGDVVASLMQHGVEHHLVLADGHHAESLRIAAAWLGVHEQNVLRMRHTGLVGPS